MAEKEQKTRAYQYKNKEIPARVRAYIQEHRMFERGETVITGISGGADSVCLFFILHYLQEELGVKLVAVHVNHGIRGEDADADERFVQNICTLQSGINCKKEETIYGGSRQKYPKRSV